MHFEVHLIKEVTVTLMRQSGEVQGFVLFPNNLYSDFIHVSTQRREKNTKQHRINLNPKNMFKPIEIHTYASNTLILFLVKGY